jgi:hypothetical protein
MPNYQVGDRFRLRDPHLDVPEYVVLHVEGSNVRIKGGHFGDLESVVTEEDMDRFLETTCERVGYRIGDQLRLRRGDPEAAPIIVVDVRGDTVQLAGVIGENAGIFEFDVGSVDEVCERITHVRVNWPMPKVNGTWVVPLERVPTEAPTARSAWDWLKADDGDE